ncbi:SART-1 family protein [Aureococcus anophagefferens]|nr:SART-1 family protein [Aureococcus anophagefferens]
MAPRGRSRSRSRSRSRERKERKERRKREKERDAEDQRAAARRAAPAPAAAPAAAAPDEKVDYAKLRDTLNLKSGGDGEVSLSVEDTDALRARLGLKPLNSSTSASATAEREAAERNFALARAAQQEARRLAEIEGELARAKRRREARAVVAGGKSLGDDGGEEELDAEAWVKRSRAAPALAKLEAERRSRLLFEQDRSDYDAGDLEGLGVAAHSAAVGRGEELILTLADEQILDYDEGKHGKLVGLRKGSGGTLVNQERAESAKREGTLADRRDERLLHAGGTATDDWEFDGGGAAHLSGAAIARLAETLGDGRSGAELGADGDAGESLKTGGKWNASAADGAGFAAQRDYLTADEAAKLFKKKAKKRRGKGSGRKALAEPTTGGVLDGLEAADDGGDRGSSATRAAPGGDADDAAAKRANYAIAQTAAQAQVDVGLGKAAPAADLQRRRRARRAGGAGADDGRQVPAGPRRRRRRRGAPGVARARALRSRKTLEGDEAAAAVATTVKAEPRAEGDAPADADALVFTAAENAEASAEAAADALAAAGGAAVKAEAGELPPDESDSDAMSDSDDESLAAAEAEDRGDLIDFLHKQPLARDGMAATMGLLRQTGDVQIKHVEQKVGRARDQTIFEDGTEDDPAAPPDPSLQFKPIKLEYRDADGRLLTRKEAFRQMCHKFHGKGPGKKKQEKFAAREAERQRSIKMSAGAGSLSILQHAQARTGQAFVPINNQTAYAAMGQPVPKKKKSKSEETYDMPPNLASAQARTTPAGGGRGRRRASRSTSPGRGGRRGDPRAVLEGKRRVLVEARVEGLDPQQPKFDRAVVDAWARDLVEKLPYGAAFVLDATAPKGAPPARDGAASREPLLRRFDAPVGDDAAPEDAVVVVFAPSSTDDMVATRVQGGRGAGVPVVVVNGAFETEPIEYRDATEVYALRPLVVAGGNTALPVRVVVNRKYPAPYDVWVDPGTGEYAKAAEFAEAPSNAELTPVIRAALEAN